MDDIDDMDIDGLDLPCPIIKERQSESSTSELTLNKHKSFAPAKSGLKLGGRKVSTNIKHEEEKVNAPSFKSNTNSIASFLKKSVNAAPSNQLLHLDMTNSKLLFTAQSSMARKEEVNFQPTGLNVTEKEKQMDMDDFDLGDLDDDDMDIDDIPEPKLK